MKFTPNLSKTEWKNGLICLTLALFLLPSLLIFIPGVTGAQVTFTGYLISAATACWCLRRYLSKNILAALDHPFATLYLAILGYFANMALVQVVSVAAYYLLPNYVNFNNQVIETQMSTDLTLMVATTVVLAPITEECFFRGLLFRGIYDRSPVWAWVLSVGLFALAHVAGFIGSYSLMELLVSLVIYIPSGVVLCVTYRRSGNLISPIIAHAIINLMAAMSATR